MKHLRTQILGIVATAVLAAFSTSAFATDTDGDGLTDAFETGFGTSTTLADTDGDGWDDDHEIWEEGTDPTLADSDGDGTNDPADPFPLVATAAVPDGATAASFTGARTGYYRAVSGRSPQDGVGVQIVDGGLTFSTSTGHAKGVRGLDHALGLSYDSKSAWDGYTGRGWHSLLDLYASVDGSNHVTLRMPGGDEVVWLWTGAVWTPPTGYSQYTLVQDGGLYKVSDARGNALSYGTSTGLELIEDRFGNTIDITYTSGRPASIVDSRGETHTIELYSATNRLKKLTMADGAEWTFKYNDRGQLWKIVGPTTTTFTAGISTEFRYTNGSTTSSLNGNMIAAFDGTGARWLKTEYDTSDRVVKQWVGDSPDPFEFDYTSIGSQSVTVTDRAGNERVWEWNATSLAQTELTEKTNRGVRSGEGDYVTVWGNDADGYMTSVTFPRGNGVKWTLNSKKLPTEKRRKTDMSAADSPTNDLIETWTYDAAKFYGVTAYTRPDGETTTYTLDADGQPTLVTFPTISHVSPTVTVTHEMTYNADGTLATFEDGEGKVTAYDYYTTGAKKGRLWKKTVDDGGLDLVTEYDYEAWGDVKSVKDPRGYTTTYTVERYGNVTKAAAPVALGYETVFAHDGNLNVTLKKVKNIDYDGTAYLSGQPHPHPAPSAPSRGAG